MTQTLFLLAPTAFLAWVWWRVRQRLAMVLMWRCRAIADELFWLGLDRPEIARTTPYRTLFWQARVLGLTMESISFWWSFVPNSKNTPTSPSNLGPVAWEIELEKTPDLLPLDRQLGRLTLLFFLTRHLWMIPLYAILAALAFMVIRPLLVVIILLALGTEGVAEVLRFFRTLKSSRRFATLLSAIRG